jgi:V-type H+-transporting ATPase subunit a
MGATLFSIDSSADKRESKLREVTSRIEDLNSVLYNTNQTRRAELLKIAESISAWWALVRKEKVIFSTLNLWQWDQGRKTLVAEGWVPSRDIGNVQSALRRASVRLSSAPPSRETVTDPRLYSQENAGTSVSALLHEIRTTKTPPTFHRTNKFTEGFQAIIDAYGIGSYEEVNPGLFTVITFPFLFAVMFGDIGHGILMTLSAATLILMEKKFKKGTGNEVRFLPSPSSPPPQPRLTRTLFCRSSTLSTTVATLSSSWVYVPSPLPSLYPFSLLSSRLRQLFAIYTGFIYNDIFSLSLHLGASQWRWPADHDGPVEAIQTASRYFFGIDPGWHGSDNVLIFTNSLKMKMSVVMGVIHVRLFLFFFLFSPTQH